MTFRLLSLAAFSAGALQAQPAPRVAGSVPPTELKVLETIRRDVWVNWFNGDTAALRRVLGPELVAISGGSEHWRNRDQTIAESADFAKGGGKFVSVTFDSNTVHRFGDVVVMFSHYAVVSAQGGKQNSTKGRATEVFVKSGGRWVHTSWHLDRAP